MSRFSDIPDIIIKSLGLIVKLPRLLIMANKNYRQFKRSFLEETTALGIPAEAAREMLDGLKPGQLYSVLRNPGRNDTSKTDTDQLGSASR